jgi:hypothetical protein
MTMAATIAMAVAPTIPVSVTVAVAMAATGISTRVSTTSCRIAARVAAGIHTSGSNAVRIHSSRSTGNDYFTRFSFNHTIATIAAAIAGH